MSNKFATNGAPLKRQQIKIHIAATKGSLVITLRTYASGSFINWMLNMSFIHLQEVEYYHVLELMSIVKLHLKRNLFFIGQKKLEFFLQMKHNFFETSSVWFRFYLVFSGEERGDTRMSTESKYIFRAQVGGVTLNSDSGCKEWKTNCLKRIVKKGDAVGNGAKVKGWKEQINRYCGGTKGFRNALSWKRMDRVKRGYFCWQNWRKYLIGCLRREENIWNEVEMDWKTLIKNLGEELENTMNNENSWGF